MMTPITSIVRFGRQARAISVPLLFAGALAAGCGTTHVAAASGGSPSGPATSAAPSASATSVPTVSGGSVVAGEPACAGWPASAPVATLPLSFVPASVERCVNGTQTLPGKGQWVTATLQQADAGLAGLINALRQPAAVHQPDTICPDVIMLPPQIVLVSETGQKLIPRFPVSGCGLIQSQVLVALGALHWQPVSVRLISRVPVAVPAATTPTAPATPVTPGTMRPQSGGGVQG
jgi:hypothetical protein